jgi:RNA polymerase sigma-70 factor, ECF subfamily
MTDLATTQATEATETAEATAITEPPTAAELEALLEQHRVALTGYCYRMLGSAFDAEDAVQETLVRAWRAFDRFDGRGTLRSWLYRIATNVCINLLNGRRRRALPMDLSPSWSDSDRWRGGAGRTSGRGRPGRPDATGTPGAAERMLVDGTWVGPVPDDLVVPPDGDPAQVAVARETIRLAFVAALQHLRPRPRAVLILHDVLRWKAREIAGLLDTSTVSVNSMLRRARDTLAARGGTTAAVPEPDDAEQRELLARYVRAFERADVESLVSLLHADATMSMPPNALWLDGRLDICAWWLTGGAECLGSALVPTATTVNGSPAFGIYRPSGPGGRYEPFAVQVMETSGGRIHGIHAFVDASLFPLFGLPTEPPT